MNREVVSSAIAALFCLALGAAGIYYALDHVKQQGREAVRKQQQGPTFGPFDDANADLLGIPRKPQLERFTIP